MLVTFPDLLITWHHRWVFVVFVLVRILAIEESFTLELETPPSFRCQITDLFDNMVQPPYLPVTGACLGVLDTFFDDLESKSQTYRRAGPLLREQFILNHLEDVESQLRRLSRQDDGSATGTSAS